MLRFRNTFQWCSWARFMHIVEEGAAFIPLERYPTGVATFIHKSFAHTVGEGANERQVYGLVYVRLSETLKT